MPGRAARPLPLHPERHQMPRDDARRADRRTTTSRLSARPRKTSRPRAAGNPKRPPRNTNEPARAPRLSPPSLVQRLRACALHAWRPDLPVPRDARASVKRSLDAALRFSGPRREMVVGVHHGGRSRSESALRAARGLPFPSTARAIWSATFLRTPARAGFAKARVVLFAMTSPGCVQQSSAHRRRRSRRRAARPLPLRLPAVCAANTRCVRNGATPAGTRGEAAVERPPYLFHRHVRAHRNRDAIRPRVPPLPRGHGSVRANPRPAQKVRCTYGSLPVAGRAPACG